MRNVSRHETRFYERVASSGDIMVTPPGQAKSSAEISIFQTLFTVQSSTRPEKGHMM